jgi:flavin reductase (DIM6/NTAB) family NADH-FMN oxidoreductase RutF
VGSRGIPEAPGTFLELPVLSTHLECGVSEIGTPMGDRSPDATGPLEIGAPAGRWLRRHLAGSATVVTTSVDGAYRGATVTSCFIASNEPLLLAVSLERDSQMLEWVGETGVFAVSILPWREKFLADQFAGFTPLASPTFAGIEHQSGDSGSPILSRSIGWADCTLEQTIVTGDHVLVIGRVLACGVGVRSTDEPLIHYAGRYLRVQ